MSDLGALIAIGGQVHRSLNYKPCIMCLHDHNYPGTHMCGVATLFVRFV
jgi:hypothetical protein